MLDVSPGPAHTQQRSATTAASAAAQTRGWLCMASRTEGEARSPATAAEAAALAAVAVVVGATGRALRGGAVWACGGHAHKQRVSPALAQGQTIGGRSKAGSACGETTWCHVTARWFKTPKSPQAEPASPAAVHAALRRWRSPPPPAHMRADTHTHTHTHTHTSSQLARTARPCRSPVTLTAFWRPSSEVSTKNSTASPSRRERKPSDTMAVWWTKRSSPPVGRAGWERGWGFEGFEGGWSGMAVGRVGWAPRKAAGVLLRVRDRRKGGRERGRAEGLRHRGRRWVAHRCPG
jgi:hypothetical protein